MLNNGLNFLHMGGYAFYVWPAYSVVCLFLLIQGILPWRRWRAYLRELGRQ